MVSLRKVTNALTFLSTGLVQARLKTMDYKKNPKC